MRLQSLLAACAASALLLPLAANAGNFPAGKEAAYMEQCKTAAMKMGLDAKKAEEHCKCGAKVIEKEFDDKEINDLTTEKDGVDANLIPKVQQKVQAACTAK